MVSSSFAVDVPWERILLIDSVQATNLLCGSEMMSWRKLTCQPRITFCSSSPASADNLFLASISSRGIGLLGWFGQAVAWMVSSAAALHLARLLVPGRLPLVGSCCQCRCRGSLLDQFRCPRLILCRSQMGRCRLRILVVGLGVGWGSVALMAPMFCCVE
jgi:hypothetical protein